MKDYIKTDTYEIEKVIREAMPKAMLAFIDNYDDFYCGWDICPKPGVLIQFRVKIGDCFDISITKYVTDLLDDKLRKNKIFHGYIPPTKDMEPDFEFIQQLLKNWASIG